MKVDKTITIQIVDTKWIVTVDNGKGKGVETKIFSVATQFESFLHTAVELK